MNNTTAKQDKIVKNNVVLYLNVIFKDIEYHIEHDTIPQIRKGAKEFIIKLNKLNRYIITLCYEDTKFAQKAKDWTIKYGLDKHITQIKQKEDSSFMKISLSFLAHYGFSSLYDQLK